MAEFARLDFKEADDLALRACLGAGASVASARALADATLSAARSEKTALGFPHLVDYLKAFEEGRIERNPEPSISRPFPACLACDAGQGVAQLGFDLAFPQLIEMTRYLGISIFRQKNSYTTGELGYYVRRLAEAGLVALAATNANAMLAAGKNGTPVFGTNPIALAFPLGRKSPPLVIDQSSSAIAYVNLVAAAAEGRSIQEDWAVDANGNPTSEPQAALAGALLPFGGKRGANIALLVEMLSAGLSGGSWSLDAPSFMSGKACPAVGLTILTIFPDQSGATVRRARNHIQRLQSLGIYMPGVTGKHRQGRDGDQLMIPVPALTEVQRYASRINRAKR